VYNVMSATCLPAFKIFVGARNLGGMVGDGTGGKGKGGRSLGSIKWEFYREPKCTNHI
jgi:hypothetical protein